MKKSLLALSLAGIVLVGCGSSSNVPSCDNGDGIKLLKEAWLDDIKTAYKRDLESMLKIRGDGLRISATPSEKTLKELDSYISDFKFKISHFITLEIEEIPQSARCNATFTLNTQDEPKALTKAKIKDLETAYNELKAKGKEEALDLLKRRTDRIQDEEKRLVALQEGEVKINEEIAETDAKFKKLLDEKLMVFTKTENKRQKNYTITETLDGYVIVR
ncbi:MAG: hypothetical protein SOW25_05690 [Helicobacter sp.]|nr:hypothetical protein [Helicobacteraceae bacterium]MDY3113802.1 hypothetical protein [Helicobacter sp.]